MNGAVAVAAYMLAASSAQAQAPQAPPAPVAQMDRAALEAEVRASRPLVRNGGVNSARPAGCTAPENRQFDFWLGEWDVSPSGQTMVIAESTISLRAQGCVLVEDWRPLAGAHGYSVNIYDSTDGKWHQEYGDATGRRTPYSGTFHDGVMYLDNLGAPPPNAPAGFRQRMNYQQIDSDTVRQWGETLTDGAWTVAWDLTYRRRAGTRP